MEKETENEQQKSEKIEVKVKTDEEKVENDQPVATGPAKVGRGGILTRLLAMFNRKRLLAAAVILVLLLGVGGYFMFMGEDKSADNAPLQDQRASLGLVVSLIDGTAKYSHDGVDWHSLTTETNLAQGDSVQTDVGSRVILTFDDGSIVRLNESSTAQLTSLYADEVRVDNISGEVYSRVVASERSFTVSVDDADYTALGTAYSTVNSDTNKGVLVLQSSVSVKDTETKVDEGKQFFKDHANAELKDKVTDISVDDLKSSSFMVWNLDQDKKTNEFKDKLGFLTKIEEQAPAPAPVPAGASVKLSGSAVAKGLKFTWTVSNIGSSHDGFKLVRSKTSTTPTYGKDDATFVSGAGTRSYTWEDTFGKTYHYRICVYTDGSCNTYSNTVTLTSPYVPPEPPTGTVSLSLSGNSASWTQTGTAPYGYRLYISPTPGAEPTTKIYKGDGAQHTVDTSGLASGSYRLLLCKTTYDGACPISDEETLIVP